MLLGKRPRAPIRRTTSMTGITVDLDSGSATTKESDQTMIMRDLHGTVGPQEGFLLDHGRNNNNSSNMTMMMMMDGIYDEEQRFLASMVSPRTNHGIRRNSSGDEFMETAHFLRSCGFCNRRLAPGKDIYMYRGDTAFCSLECREHQMKQDERTEKCKMMAASKKKEGSSSSSSHASASTTASKASTKSETVAAA